MPTSFSARLLRWFDRHGRHDLPWQHPRTPYRVWLAEIMLQQTQVATVIPYYRRFLKRFPSLPSLAVAELDDVLALWSGLGYYARARNLHAAARVVMHAHGGRFPRDFAAVAALPGIGRSTAGAILAQAFGQRHAILDGNVRRVLARHQGIGGWPGAPRVADLLWRAAEARLPGERLADYTQALMDLGATVCTTGAPRCAVCPLRRDCIALAQNRVHELPAPRPRRARPQRRAQLLLLENRAGAILLERRPPTGIWGGLWCPPMIGDGADQRWREICVSRYGLRAGRLERLPPVRHGFTHFDLDLTPLRLRARPDTPLDDAPDRAWVAPLDTARYGLPAPVRRLLQATYPSLP